MPDLPTIRTAKAQIKAAKATISTIDGRLTEFCQHEWMQNTGLGGKVEPYKERRRSLIIFCTH
eukprot:6592545-Alexandrium_andersonii.AAC.1